MLGAICWKAIMHITAKNVIKKFQLLRDVQLNDYQIICSLCWKDFILTFKQWRSINWIIISNFLDNLTWRTILRSTSARETCSINWVSRKRSKLILKKRKIKANRKLMTSNWTKIRWEFFRKATQMSITSIS